MSDAMPALTKTCTNCGETKSLDGFARNKRRALGRQSVCRSCASKYHREWYAKNREIVLEKERQRNAANPEANRERVKAWRLANPERARENARKGKQRRRERERAAAVEHVDYDALWEGQQGRCAICADPIDLSLPAPHPLSKSTDHIIPLAKGGLTTQENMQFLHLRCNALKSASLPEESESA